MNILKKHQHDLIALVVVIGVYVLVTIAINPMREGIIEDEWAFVNTVRNLVETGTYERNAWMAPNPIFQIYWGAGFATISEPSFATLRLSAIVLVMVGIVGLYGLLRESGCDPFTAALGVGVAFGNPFVMRFTFAFMSDMPMVAFLMLSMWLYVRGFRLRNAPTILAAAIAATLALLTRQVALGLLPGIVVAWLFLQQRRQDLSLLGLGLVLPLLATVWQFYVASVDERWVYYFFESQQTAYFENTLLVIATTFWRGFILLHYTALFCLPLVPVAVYAFWQDTRQATPQRRRWSMIFTIGLVVIVGIGAFVIHPPMLLLPWSLGPFPSIPFASVMLTVATGVGAVVFWRIVGLRYVEREMRGQVPRSIWLVDAASLVMLALTMGFFQLLDRYLFVLIPVMLVALLPYLQRYIDGGLKWLTVAITLVTMVVGTLSVSGAMNYSVAEYAAGQTALETGALPEEVVGYWTWDAYHGAWDRYIVAQGDTYPDHLSEFLFGEDYTKRLNRATYLMTATDFDQTEWMLVEVFTYRDAWFQEQNLYLLQRR